MLSSTAEYALRIMVALARRQAEVYLKGKEIAKEAEVSEAYTAKILNALNRAGLVRAQKGLKGGYLLGKPAQEISLFDIIHAVDPFTTFNQCPFGVAEHRAPCLLRKKLDNVYAEFQKIFKECSLSEFSKNRDQPLECVHESRQP